MAFGLASAAQAAPQRPMVEASMLITGTIVIAPDGSVRSHAIDHPEKVPVTIREFVGNAIAAWKFEPILVDGKPVVVHTNMNMRLVMDPLAHGSYSMRVGGVSFAGGDPSQICRSITPQTVLMHRSIHPTHYVRSLAARSIFCSRSAVKVRRWTRRRNKSI